MSGVGGNRHRGEVGKLSLISIVCFNPANQLPMKFKLPFRGFAENANCEYSLGSQIWFQDSLLQLNRIFDSCFQCF